MSDDPKWRLQDGAVVTPQGLVTLVLVKEIEALRAQLAAAEAERDRLRTLMREAVMDFHGKTVLFSFRFLYAAEGRR